MMQELKRSAIGCVIFAFCAAALAQSALSQIANRAVASPAAAEIAITLPQEDASLVIDNDSDLPPASAHVDYEVRFRAHGAVGAQHWRLQKGALPPGMKLEDDGQLHGQAERTGEFQFTLEVMDSRRSDSRVQKGFTLRVRSGLTVDWKSEAHVGGSRIDGSVEVSNQTADDMDLTFYVLAVAENGRATAIGYQRFTLRRGSTMDLPFGETLPYGSYQVHADVVGEVAAKNLIYREHMQSPHQLQVTVGP